jgi:hypothetical protein
MVASKTIRGTMQELLEQDTIYLIGMTDIVINNTLAIVLFTRINY